MRGFELGLKIVYDLARKKKILGKALGFYLMGGEKPSVGFKNRQSGVFIHSK